MRWHFGDHSWIIFPSFSINIHILEITRWCFNLKQNVGWSCSKVIETVIGGGFAFRLIYMGWHSHYFNKWRLKYPDWFFTRATESCCVSAKLLIEVSSGDFEKWNFNNFFVLIKYANGYFSQKNYAMGFAFFEYTHQTWFRLDEYRLLY